MSLDISILTSKVPGLTSNAASFPFANPIGQVIKIVPSEIFSKPEAVPGVMVLKYLPTIGYSDTKDSAVNLAMFKFFAEVRKNNSGYANYEAPDMFMMMMAGASVIAMIADFTRALDLVGVFSGTNKYIGDNLLTALGYDPDYLRANQANLRTRINTAIHQFNASIKIPKEFGYAQRSIYLNTSLFTDYKGNKFQIYAMKQDAFYKWYATAYATGSSLQGEQNFNRSGDNMLVNIEKAISYLLTDSDIRIMCGDILRAYGEGNVIQLSPVSDTPKQLELTYDVQMLDEIHNARALDYALVYSNSENTSSSVMTSQISFLVNPTDEEYYTNNAGIVIYQSNGYIQSRPSFSIEDESFNDWTYWDTDDVLLDIPMDAPKPDNVVRASRLSASVDTETAPVTVNQRKYRRIVCGTELVKEIQVFSLAKTSSTIGATEELQSVTVPGAIYARGQYLIHRKVMKLLQSVLQMSVFDWHPLTKICIIDTSADAIPSASNFKQLCTYFGDLSNYTIIKERNLSTLHQAVLMNLLHIPVATSNS